MAAEETLRPLIEKLQETVERVDEKVDTQGVRLERVEKGLKTHGARMEKGFEEQGARLGRIERSVDVLAKHLEPLPDQVGQLDRRLATFQTETEANFAEVHDRLDTVETTVRGQEKRITAAERKVG